MKRSEFKQILVETLPTSSSIERRQLLEVFFRFDFELKNFKDLLFSETTLATRFAWFLSGIGERDSEKLFPHLDEFFTHRDAIKIKNFERSLAKWFYLSGVPESIEGKVFEALSQWFLNPKIVVSTKRYVLLAMFEMAKKYEDLKIELKELIQDQLDKNTPTFKKFAKTILIKL